MKKVIFAVLFLTLQAQAYSETIVCKEEDGPFFYEIEKIKVLGGSGIFDYTFSGLVTKFGPRLGPVTEEVLIYQQSILTRTCVGEIYQFDLASGDQANIVIYDNVYVYKWCNQVSTITSQDSTKKLVCNYK